MFDKHSAAARLSDILHDKPGCSGDVHGPSHATVDHVNFDYGVVATESSTTVIRDSVTSPKYIRRSDGATVTSNPRLPVENLGKEY